MENQEKLLDWLVEPKMFRQVFCKSSPTTNGTYCVTIKIPGTTSKDQWHVVNLVGYYFSDCVKFSTYYKFYFVGYENGALFTQIGQSAKIRLPRTEGVPIKDLPLDFQCRGDESNLAQCNVTYGSRECNINYNSVFLVCNKPPIALCPEGQTPFDGYCYEMNTIPENFTTAQSSCKAKGGALLEITR